MRKLLALALVLVGCSSADPVSFGLAPELGTDAGDAAPTPTSTGTGEPQPPPHVDGGAAGGAADTGAGDAATVDAIATVDAGIDAAADAGNVPEASAPDIAPDAVAVDSAPPSVDAGSDAKTAPEAAPPVDARSDATLPCSSSPATCDSVNRAEAAIRATYPQPCTTDAHQCGGVVQDGTAVTYPMTCKVGAWSLAWCLNAACYSCSSMCPVGQLCAP